VLAPPGMHFMTDAVAALGRGPAGCRALTYGGVRWTWGQWHDRIRRVAGGLGRARPRARRPGGVPGQEQPGLPGGSAGRRAARRGLRRGQLAAGGRRTGLRDQRLGGQRAVAGADLLPAVEAIRDRLPASPTSSRWAARTRLRGLPRHRPARRPRPLRDRGGPVAGDVQLRHDRAAQGRDAVAPQHRRAHQERGPAGAAGTGRPQPGRDAAVPRRRHCYALFGIYSGAPSTFTREPDPASLLAAFAAGATHAFWYRPWCPGCSPPAEGDHALSGLKYLLYGAAPMPLPMLRQALAAWPGPELRPGLRPDRTGRRDQRPVPAGAQGRLPARPARLGRHPAANAEVRVVDPATGQDVAAGRPGEFWFARRSA